VIASFIPAETRASGDNTAFADALVAGLPCGNCALTVSAQVRQASAQFRVDRQLLGDVEGVDVEQQGNRERQA
jgi:hypothetical protein